MTPGVVVVAALTMALGVVSEAVGYEWRDPLLWVPDLLVGLVWVAAGVRFWSSRPWGGALAWGVGMTWFLANLVAVGVYWHRALLIHLVVALAFPRRNSWALGAVAIGYVASLVPQVWLGEGTTLAVASAILVAVVLPRRGRGRTSLARVAQSSLVVILLVLMASALTRLAAPTPGGGALSTLLAYEATLIAVALVLVAAGGDADSDSLADQVLELSDGPASSLRDALADVLDDPDLEVGYWRELERGYTDLDGRSVMPPPAGSGRMALPIRGNDRPVALIVHASSLQGDPRLEAALAVATRLVTANADLRARVNERRVELAASRLRLVQAADLERAHLASVLRLGPQARLATLLDTLGTAPDPQSHLALAVSRVEQTLDDLDRWERGLHPRELENGLGPALTSLARTSSTHVTVTVTGGRLSAALEISISYVCAEAVANVIKHGAAEHATVDVARFEDHVSFSVVDDGVGGADPEAGTGLRGGRDRLEAFGGTLTVLSTPGHGTRLSGEVPLSLADFPFEPTERSGG